MMRIAHVTATFPPYRGGTGNVCFQSARALARRGHEVHVFTAAQLGPPGEEVGAGVMVHRLRALLRVGNAPFLPGLLGALRGFGVIHLHYPFIGGAEMVRLATVLYRTPLVISFHNDLIGDGARAPAFSLYQRLSARLTVTGAARLGVSSRDHYQSSRLRQALGGMERTVVEVPPGVDTAHFSPDAAPDDLRQRFGIPESHQLVLFVAALDRAHHFKGLGLLLQVMPLLPPSTWLLVVGDGDLRQAYERQATALGIADRIIFAGGIDQAHLPPFYRSADVTVLPSAPPESFGLVLIESLACGTPVITSDIPGVRTVVDHGRDGLLIAPGDRDSLRSAIEQLLGDRCCRTAMGHAGRAKAVERYRWEAIGAQLETLYRQVVGEGYPATVAVAESRW